MKLWHRRWDILAMVAMVSVMLVIAVAVAVL